MAHRECMKKYLVQTQIFSCEICKANYAVGKSSNKILTHITPALITSWLGKTFVYFVVIVVVILLIIYITSFDEDSQVVRSWKTALIILFSLVLSLLVIYMILVVKRTVKKLQRSDIEVYCYQTEIRFHSKNPKKILKDYYDNIAQISMLEDYSDIEFDEDIEEIGRRDIYEPTNASLLQTLQTREGKIYYGRIKKENEFIERFLNAQDEEKGLRNPKRSQEEEELFQNEVQQTEQNYYPPAESMKFGNIGKIRKITNGPRKYQNETFDEVSSIKVDLKAQKNNESFHSVENVITEDLKLNDFKKKPVPEKSLPEKKMIETKKMKYKEEKKEVEKNIQKLISLEDELNRQDRLNKNDEILDKDKLNYEDEEIKEESLTLNLEDKKL